MVGSRRVFLVGAVLGSSGLAALGLATTGGPFAAGVLRDASGSYALLAPAVIVILLLAIPAILIAEREGRLEVT